MKKLTQKLAQKLMKIKGEVRGVSLKADAEFVLNEKGPEGLKKVEEKLREIGFPIEYQKINQFAFYPLGLRILSLLAIQEVFNWSSEKIKKMGSYGMKISWIIRLFARYFFSIETTLRFVPKVWNQYFTVGSLKVLEYNLEKKYVILKLEKFDLHPLYCKCLEGIFEEIGRQVLNPKKIECQEIECSFRKGSFHKFLVKWE